MTEQQPRSDNAHLPNLIAPIVGIIRSPVRASILPRAVLLPQSSHTSISRMLSGASPISSRVSFVTPAKRAHASTRRLFTGIV
jgi:hypothetical protein